MFRVSFNRLVLLLMLFVCIFMIVLSLKIFNPPNSAKFIHSEYVDRNVEAAKELDVNRRAGPTNKQNNIQFGDLDKIKKIQAILGLPDDFAHVGGKHPEEQLAGIQELVNEYLGANAPADKTLNNIMKILFKNNPHKIKPTAYKTGNQSVVDSKVTQKMREAEVAEDKVLSINELLERPPPNPPKIERVKPNDLPYIREKNYRPSECPTSYNHKAEHSEWFRERYIPNVKMFLTKEDVNSFESYHKLSHYGMPFGFARENRTSLAEVLNHPNYTDTSVYGTLSDKACTRCAVVGCGGVLKGAGRGPEIDAHDHVFRVNRALTRGRFANDVGKRTSVYTFFPESDYTREIEDTETVHALYALFKNYDIDFAGNMLKDIPPPLYVTSQRGSWSVFIYPHD